MSTIKNDQILLYCHFNKIIKGPGTSFKTPELSQKHVRNVCHMMQQYLTKLGVNKRKYNFHYVAMPTMT